MARLVGWSTLGLETKHARTKADQRPVEPTVATAATIVSRVQSVSSDDALKGGQRVIEPQPQQRPRLEARRTGRILGIEGITHRAQRRLAARGRRGACWSVGEPAWGPKASFVGGWYSQLSSGRRVEGVAGEEGKQIALPGGVRGVARQASSSRGALPPVGSIDEADQKASMVSGSRANHAPASSTTSLCWRGGVSAW